MIQERVDAHTSNWARAGEITAFDRLRTLTFDIITHALLGVVPRDELGRFGAAFESLSRGVLAPIKWDLPWTAYGRALRAKRRLESWIGTAIEQARSNLRDDFLGSLLRDHAGQSSPYTDDAIVSQVLGLLFDAQDTTVTLMSWLLFGLDRHPDVLERLRDEAHTMLARKEITTQRLASMRYLDAVIQEIGRLHHPAPALPQKVVRAFEFNGYSVPAGSLVLYSPAASHRLPEIFDNPEVFDPSRLLPPREEHKREPFGLVTFGGGPRTCLGAPFALTEMKVLTAMLALGYHRSVMPHQDLRPRHLPTKRPRSGLRLRFRRLSDSVADAAT